MRRLYALALTGCLACGSPGPKPKSLPAKRTLALDASGIYRVQDLQGRSLVILGKSSEPPKGTGNRVVVGKGQTIELTDEIQLDESTEFTVVDKAGTCVSSASRAAKIAQADGWRDAVVLDGCHGDPTRVRFALGGNVADARYLEPETKVTADGQPIPSTEFFDSNVSGQMIVIEQRFRGLDLVFESRGRDRGMAPTRLLKGTTPLASYRGRLIGALRANSKWYFRFEDRRGNVSLLELVADTLVPKLGTPPESAPLKPKETSP